MKRLYRSRTNKVFSGICGGIGEYFEIDPVIIRLITVLLMIFIGLPVFIYLIAIFIIPKAPLEGSEATGSPVVEPKPRELSPQEKERERARMDEHIKILSILYIALHALGIIIAAIIFSLLYASGWVIGEDEAVIVLRIVGIVVPVILVLFSLPGIFAGLGLLKKESWARTLAMILGILNLLNVPVGTVLGIYTIWVLSNQEAQELFH